MYRALSHITNVAETYCYSQLLNTGRNFVANIVSCVLKLIRIQIKLGKQFLKCQNAIR